MLARMSYWRPATLSDALQVKARNPVRILAGGTDFYPALRDGPVNFPVLDTSAIPELRHIHKDGSHWSIGANATWMDVQRAALPSAFDGLKQAAREVGSIQIQNRATVVGNICNASPAADGVPPLLTLNAEIEIVSATGRRRQLLADFILGNRKTTLAADEIVSRILVSDEEALGNAAFVKLGARKYLVISIAMVAARVEMRRGRISKASIAVGACAETAKRLPRLEAHFVDCRLRDVAAFEIKSADLQPLSPISDVRATAEYRQMAVVTLIRSAVAAAMASGA
jgi:CO/xanthine dehydrogenase FAD-binding subunit